MSWIFAYAAYTTVAWTSSQRGCTSIQTLAARGLEEHVRITLIFSRISVSCFIYCVTLAYVLFSKNFWFTIHIVDSWFWRIIDRICWAYAIFRWTPNLQVCTDRQTDRQTDGQTDELIRVGLGNLFGSSRLISVILCTPLSGKDHNSLIYFSVQNSFLL
jgi:hypothetical protein